jgi:putative ATP-dependent endonuclease of the OLD family
LRLSKVRIENFRGIACAEIELNRDITVLVGENNTGKTTVLEVLRLCLDAVKSEKTCNFTEFDFYREESYKNLVACKPITLTLTFLESEEHSWPAHITQDLNEVIVGSDYSVIKLRVTAWYDDADGETVQSWCFLDAADHELVGKNGFIKDLRRLRPFFFQTALRAAKDQFHGQSTYWASFLKNKDIDEGIRKELEKDLFEVNRKIVDAHSSFKHVTEEVKLISELVAVGKVDSVTVDPAPADVYSALRYGTNVNLLTASNAKIPICSHGEGTQSLSVLLLFSAYLKARLHADVDRQAEPIIAIEEPEAHLHPNAVRAVWQLLEGLPGQKIVATHSGDILSEVPLESLRRMNRQGLTTECRAIPASLLSPEELRKFNYHVRRNRGELLFARTWLLVEGETDVSILAECADLLGIDFHRLGIRTVECSQAGGPGIFIKVADALGIKWHLVADGDDGGNQYVKAARGFLDTRPEADHISILSTPNMDILLCHSGYGNPYLLDVVTQTPNASAGSWDDVLAEMKKTFSNKPGQALRVAKKLEDRSQPEITSAAGTIEYWEEVYQNLSRRFSKPAAAMDAILLMREKGKGGVPPELAVILERTKALAEVTP